MSANTPALPWAHPLRIADLPNRAATEFSLVPDAPTRAAIASELGLQGLKKLRFTGQLQPHGKSDWQLTAKLGATVTQSCVVTLAPVSTRIDEKLTRTYLAMIPEDDTEQGEEIEMPDDESVDRLGAWLDLGEVMIEALELILPAYPRAEGAEMNDANFSAEGVTPMTDEDTKPFAGLAALRNKLQDK
jgi:uncharacterized metal-binding protein YceD (DUF177 family)